MTSSAMEGFRKAASFARVADDVVRAARPFGTATLHEAAGKIGALPSSIKPTSKTFTCCGPAFTVHSPPHDNLWLHRAIAVASPGDILVVYVGGGYEAGYWGEIMSTAAQARKLGGVIIDGCVRDSQLLETLGFPVFSRGLCIRGTGKDFEATGWLGQPVLIGDICVQSGDLVAGDADGVVVIPREAAAAAVEASAIREAKEAEIMEQLKKGALTLDLYGWNR